MAGSQPSRDDKPSKSDDQNHNPFIAFRRFADEQVSSLLGLVGSVSNDIAKTAQERQQEVIERMERGTHPSEKCRNSKKDTNSDSLSTLDRMVADTEKQLDNAFLGWEKQLDSVFSGWDKRVEEARQQGEEWRKKREDERMQGDEWEGTVQKDEDGNTWHTVRWGDSKEGWMSRGQRSTMESATSSAGEATAQPASAFWHSQFPQPSFFLFSRYSPLVLEQQRDPPFPWRDAFEDLLRAERKQSIQDRKFLGLHNYESPEDWLHGLWKRTRHPGLSYCTNPHTTLQRLRRASPFWEQETAHVFDPIGSFLRGPFWISGGLREGCEGHNPKHINELFEEDEDEDADDAVEEVDDLEDGAEDQDEDDESFTEQDLYERHFGISGPSSNESDRPTVIEDHVDGKKPSILSTLTSTERIVHPDGSITTKVVLKKRFSDGKEESSETVHNSVDGSDPKLESSLTASPPATRSPKSNTEAGRKQVGRGWFWSS